MFLKNEIDETFIKKFAELGVTTEENIITILNGLDEIAEIGYVWYRNKLAKKDCTND